jgi:hypothetical protein
MTAAELRRVPFRATQDRMMTLGELCDFVAGRATLLIELKSPRVDDRRLAARTAKVLSGYGGQTAVMSFQPAQIVELRGIAPRLPRGMAVRQHAWRDVSAAPKRAMTAVAQGMAAGPQFIAYSVSDLPALFPRLARDIFGLPLLAWTVRSEDERRKAARYADQMIFEGFRP